MFKRLLKNKKAQQTAEYALLISLVIAAVVAMQTYAQRSLQARIKDAGAYLANTTQHAGAGMGDGDAQYEPYYLEQVYEVERSDETTERQVGGEDGTISTGQVSNTIRSEGGYKAMSFNKDDSENW